MNKSKILVICGPTSIGKTKIALDMANKFQGELISADSRQVYKGMDIGTGKEISNIKYQISKTQIKNKKFTRYEINRISCWLWDIVKPNQRFSVSDYYKFAWTIIKDIWVREKLPIVVGGTGLYIKAVIDGLDTFGIPADWNLRKKLEVLTTKELQDIIIKKNIKKWGMMNNSDRNNRRRLIRAIEVTSKNQKYKLNIKKNFNIYIIGLTTNKEELFKRIDRRVEKRIDQGVISETQQLLAKGYNFKIPAMSSLGYRQLHEYIEGKINLKEALEKWKSAENNFAKRQLTWFKKDKRVNWYDISKAEFELKIEQNVSSWYNK